MYSFGEKRARACCVCLGSENDSEPGYVVCVCVTRELTSKKQRDSVGFNNKKSYIYAASVWKNSGL